MASSAVASPVVMASMARVTISWRTGEPGSGNGAAASPRSCPHRDTPTRPDQSPQTDRLAGLRRLACPGLHVAGAANTVIEPHCPYAGKITSSPAVPAFHGSGLSTAARYAACGNRARGLPQADPGSGLHGRRQEGDLDGQEMRGLGVPAVRVPPGTGGGASRRGGPAAGGGGAWELGLQPGPAPDARRAAAAGPARRVPDPAGGRAGAGTAAVTRRRPDPDGGGLAGDLAGNPGPAAG